MNLPESLPDDREASEPSWNCEELERLYRQALDAVDAVSQDLQSANATLSSEGEGSPPEESTSQQGAISAAVVDETTRPTPERVIEALLFVGGKPLSAKTISAVLRDDFAIEMIEEAIGQLNRNYVDQNRPYGIRLSDAGYQMVLRPEFEPVRSRVYGYGPRQVRLSQDALEVLAVVAYRQPISRSAIEQSGRPNAGSHLRQLLARDLICIDRGAAEGADKGEVKYRTSARFLQLFGLRRLGDLPQIDDIEFK